MDILTKENFWNEVSEKYPKATAHFKEWIDKYKEENNWEHLFANFYMKSYVDNSALSQSNRDINKRVIQLPKYHDLPHRHAIWYIYSVCRRNNGFKGPNRQ